MHTSVNAVALDVPGKLKHLNRLEKCKPAVSQSKHRHKYNFQNAKESAGNGAIIRKMGSDHSTKRSSKAVEVTRDDCSFCMAIIYVSQTVHKPVFFFVVRQQEYR